MKAILYLSDLFVISSQDHDHDHDHGPLTTISAQGEVTVEPSVDQSFEA
jgi:hypothetical protein